MGFYLDNARELLMYGAMEREIILNLTQTQNNQIIQCYKINDKNIS